MVDLNIKNKSTSVTQRFCAGDFVCRQQVSHLDPEPHNPASLAHQLSLEILSLCLTYCDYRGANMPTQHLHEYWESEFQSLHLLSKHFHLLNISPESSNCKGV